MILPVGWSCYLVCVFLGCCALFTACSKQQAQETHANNTLQAQLGQAKHFDVPVPLGFSLNESSSTSLPVGMTDFMRYTGPLSISQVIDFYTREMEMSGWNMANHSVPQEALMYCSKPKKLCCICVRSSHVASKDHAVTISLFITQKA